MRVLYLLDEDFATRERRLVERLEVGLAAEGVQSLCLQPAATIGEAPSANVTGKTLTFPAFGPLASVHQRARLLEGMVREAIKDEPGDGVDIVHVFAPSLWSLAGQLATLLDASWAIEAWSDAGMTKALRLRTGRGVGSPVILAADPALIDNAGKAGSSSAVRRTPWGVHALPAPRNVLREGSTISVVLSAGGLDTAAMHAALAGAAALAKIEERALIFVEAGAAAKAKVWREAESLGLLSRLSLIPDLEIHRDLVLACDVLVLPDHSGQVRTLGLEALACGMAVVASRDDRLTYWRGDEPIGRFVVPGDRKGWVAALEAVVRDRSRSRELARQGWSRMREQRRVSAHVQSVLDSYQWMRSKDAMPFTSTK